MMSMIFSKSMLLYRHSKRKEVMAARLMFARQLMVRYGVPYGCVWSLSGFSSMKDMERHWNDLF